MPLKQASEASRRGGAAVPRLWPDAAAARAWQQGEAAPDNHEHQVPGAALCHREPHPPGGTEPPRFF